MSKDEEKNIMTVKIIKGPQAKLQIYAGPFFNSRNPSIFRCYVPRVEKIFSFKRDILLKYA